MQQNRPRQSFSIHPYRIFVFLLIAAIAVLFLSLTISYGYTRVEKGLHAIPVPPIFLLNTFLLIATSLCLIRAKKAFQMDKTKQYKGLLFSTIILSLSFLGCQVVGWTQMFRTGWPLGQENGISYLYLISGVHFAHILIGLPFLIAFYRSAVSKMMEPVGALLYFTDPEKKVKLDMITLYWHFLDILWIYLVVFFSVNALI